MTRKETSKFYLLLTAKDDYSHTHFTHFYNQLCVSYIKTQAVFNSHIVNTKDTSTFLWHSKYKVNKFIIEQARYHSKHIKYKHGYATFKTQVLVWEINSAENQCFGGIFHLFDYVFWWILHYNKLKLFDFPVSPLKLYLETLWVILRGPRRGT
jgi:hypothetical protein